MEILEDRSGRRLRSEGERAQIAAESLVPGVRVADVARRHDVTRWQVYDWRKKLKAGLLALPAETAKEPMFAALVVEPKPTRPSRRPKKRNVTAKPGKIELVVDGVTLRVSADIDGLALVVQERMDLDPFSGAAFVFRAKRADRIKVLVWDQTGIVLVHKRLEGAKFVWPAVRDGVMTMSRSAGAKLRRSGMMGPTFAAMRLQAGMSLRSFRRCSKGLTGVLFAPKLARRPALAG